jgi:alkylation response protein AidB-like acyl-CoA dehydrogenase
MFLQFTDDELAFREEVRAFIRDHLPKHIHDRLRLGYLPQKQDIVEWQRILNRRGWAAYHWPKAYGGPGWTPIQGVIFLDETQTAPAPELQYFNINMIGPILIRYGSEEQKRRFLPRAANLDDWWCQGFSEPGAGSDLASLKTAARRETDHYIVTGQKLWTSTAHEADWCFCLVRTDRTAKKRQEGISFLLVDMRSPGITIRPIISMDGTHHLNEVFFDDVKVPAAMRVGEENGGWEVAKSLLGGERVGITRLGKSKERIAAGTEMAGAARANGKCLTADPLFRQRIAQMAVEIRALEITQMRITGAEGAARDGDPDPLSSLLKIRGTEILQAATELAMDVGGPQSMPNWPFGFSNVPDEPQPVPPWTTEAARSYLFFRAASIFGGTNEIQKNILARTILGV